MVSELLPGGEDLVLTWFLPYLVTLGMSQSSMSIRRGCYPQMYRYIPG